VSATLALTMVLATAAVPMQDAPAAGGRLTELSLEELGSVEVTTVSKEPETVWKTAAAVSVLTREDIRRSGATSLPELLRLVPGVAVARIDAGHWSVGVRGFGDQFSKSVLVLIDGRSLYTPLFAGVFWALQDTLLEDVERIEVIRGPGGTIWGASAVNGVINVITRRPAETRGTLASVAGGTVDPIAGGFRHGGGTGRGFDYRVYGKGFLRGPQHHLDGQDFDEGRMAQAGFTAGWERAAGGALTLQGDLYRGRHGQSVSLASFSPPAQRVVRDPLHVSGGNLLAQWRRSWSGGGEASVRAYYDRTRLSGPQLLEVRDTFDLDLIHRLPLGTRHHFTWGLGARVSPGRFTATVDTLDFAPARRTATAYTAFLQDEVALVPEAFRLTVGAKLEHNNYTGFEVQPSARVLWSIAPRQAAWAAVTRAVRTPSRIERDFRLNAFLAASPLTYLQVDGSDTFTSERLIAYEAGYRVLAGTRVYVDLVGFRNRYEDLAGFGAGFATMDTAPGPPHVTLHLPFANAVEGTTHGFELAPDWKPWEWWQLRGSYSFIHFALRNKAGITDEGALAAFEDSTPHHQVVLRSSMDLGRSLELDLAFRRVGALPARTVESYATLDARVGWRLRPGLDLSVVGHNLLQPWHAEFGHDPPPVVGIRRSVYARLTWQR
jgi:iron complex outermembrane recepter protein